MFDNKKFTKIIKKSNYTSAKLSNELMKIGVKLTKNSIDSYRKGGIKNPPIDKLSAIADLLNVDVSNFFNIGDKTYIKILGLASHGLSPNDTCQTSDNMLTFGEKLKKARKDKKISQEKLAKMIDVNRVAISNYEQNKNTPTLTNLNKIIKALELDPGYFGSNDKIQVKKIKIVGLTSCGLPLPDIYQASDEFVYVSEDIYSPDIYALKCCGDSMSPEIEDSDTVVCKPVNGIDDLKNGDLVHYTLQNESAVKIYYRDNDNFFIQFIPYNKSDDFRTINIRLDGEKIHYLKIAKVIAVIKQNINNRQSRLKLAGVL